MSYGVIDSLGSLQNLAFIVWESLEIDYNFSRWRITRLIGSNFYLCSDLTGSLVSQMCNEREKMLINKVKWPHKNMVIVIHLWAWHDEKQKDELEKQVCVTRVTASSDKRIQSRVGDHGVERRKTVTQTRVKKDLSQQ